MSDGNRVRFEDASFKECIRRDAGLAGLRADYARKSAEERRMEADWEYHRAIADNIFNESLAKAGQEGFGEAHWPEGILALTVDPLYAPAILTVVSFEYQLGREEEAMELFMTLTSLPPEEEDLPDIIDKAGGFLIDQKDYEQAQALYAAAEAAFPDVAIYPAGLSYCFGKLGMHEEAVTKALQAVELDPDSYLHLNDLGWSLYEAGKLDEAEAALRRSIALAPDDYEYARNNLEIVMEGKAGGDGD